MSVLYAYLISGVLFVIGSYLLYSSYEERGFSFLLIAFIFAGVIRETPTSLFYQIGPKEYLVKNDSVVAQSEYREFRITKPKGKKRSYATIRDTFLWKPNSPTYPKIKSVLEIKGTVELAERYYSVYDSLRSVLPDTINPEPLAYLGCRVYPGDRFIRVVNKGLRLNPVVRIRSITFVYQDSLSTRDCQESDK